LLTTPLGVIPAILGMAGALWAQAETSTNSEVSSQSATQVQNSTGVAFRLPLQQQPPAPTCESYTMQTLPTDGFHNKQRICYWRSQLFTSSALFGSAIAGEISQLRHKPPEWPQGADGFGRQMGTRYTQGMVKSTGAFVVSMITREDPRPKPPPMTGSVSTRFGCRASTSFGGRLGQSLLRTVWNACAQNPWRRPAPSRLAGSFASGFVGLAWAPPSQAKTADVLVNSGTAFGGYLVESVLSEFQPEIYRVLGGLLPKGKKP
jgi:hypothetical protein